MKNLLITLLIFQFLSSCSSNKISIIAHRGASGYLPEHTLESASLAHGLNPDFIEPDVVLTKDNIPIVLHDIHLESTTNVEQVFPDKKRVDGHWYAIDLNLEEIKRLKVHERFNNKKNKPYFKNRFPLNTSHFSVPTLQEFIDLIKGLNVTRNKFIGIYLEIKKPSFHLKQNKDILKIVHQLMLDNNLHKEKFQTIIQCFELEAIKTLKLKFKTPFKLVYLIGKNSWKESKDNYDFFLTNKGLSEVSKYAHGIGPWIPLVVKIENNQIHDTGLVHKAHRYNLIVHPYTHRHDDISQFTTEEELLGFLKQLNIDGIFSDHPDIANKALNN